MVKILNERIIKPSFMAPSRNQSKQVPKKRTFVKALAALSKRIPGKFNNQVPSGDQPPPHTGSNNDDRPSTSKDVDCSKENFQQPVYRTAPVNDAVTGGVLRLTRQLIQKERAVSAATQLQKKVINEGAYHLVIPDDIRHGSAAQHKKFIIAETQKLDRELIRVKELLQLEFRSIEMENEVLRQKNVLLDHLTDDLTKASIGNSTKSSNDNDTSQASNVTFLLDTKKPQDRGGRSQSASTSQANSFEVPVIACTSDKEQDVEQMTSSDNPQGSSSCQPFKRPKLTDFKLSKEALAFLENDSEGAAKLDAYDSDATKPNVNDFALSDEARRMLQLGPQGGKHLRRNGIPAIFDESTFIEVTPGIFNGRDIRSPGSGAQDIPSSLRRFRDRNRSRKGGPTSSNALKPIAERADDSSGGSKAGSAIGSSGGLQHSKGSLNGSLIEMDPDDDDDGGETTDACASGATVTSLTFDDGDDTSTFVGSQVVPVVIPSHYMKSDAEPYVHLPQRPVCPHISDYTEMLCDLPKKPQRPKLLCGDLVATPEGKRDINLGSSSSRRSAFKPLQSRGLLAQKVGSITVDHDISAIPDASSLSALQGYIDSDSQNIAGSSAIVAGCVPTSAAGKAETSHGTSSSGGPATGTRSNNPGVGLSLNQTYLVPSMTNDPAGILAKFAIIGDKEYQRINPELQSIFSHNDLNRYLILLQNCISQGKLVPWKGGSTFALTRQDIGALLPSLNTMMLIKFMEVLSELGRLKKTKADSRKSSTAALAFDGAADASYLDKTYYSLK